MPVSVLDGLLDLDLGHDPVTTGGLSNHLPMVMLALGRLGASDRRLVEYADMYCPRLVPARGPTLPVEASEIGSALGTGERYADLRRFFTSEVEQHGVGEVLATRLPALLEGLGGAAFHGIIRLGYAVEHRRAADIIAALAYLADTHRALRSEPATSGSGRLDPAALLADIADEPQLSDRHYGVTGFSGRFAEVADSPSLGAHLGRFDNSGDIFEPLGGIASLVHQIYDSTHDFFALHMMTATHATRLAIVHLGSADAQQRAVSSLMGAVAAAYVVIGAPRLEAEPILVEAPTWSEVRAAAVLSDDEHVIKLVHTCRSEAEVWGDNGYVETAATAVGLVS